MKFRFNGEKTTSISSLPPGVTMQVKPGATVEVDAGFEYLKGDGRFELVEDDKGSAEAAVETKKKK